MWSSHRNQPLSKHPGGKEENRETNRAGRGLEMHDSTEEKKSEIKTVERLFAHQPPRRCKISVKRQQQGCGAFGEDEIQLIRTEHCSLFTRFNRNPSQILNFTPSRDIFIADFKTIAAVSGYNLSPK